MAPGLKTQSKGSRGARHEQAQVQRFIELTGVPADVARYYLRQFNFDVNSAYDSLAREVTMSNVPQRMSIDKEEAARKALNKQFDQYSGTLKISHLFHR